MAAEASSSLLITSKTPIHKKFDVFISFRGTDTRDNIVSHIYDRLCRSNIQTFIDNELMRGEEISPSLLRKIEESKISLVVFSKNYASSRWCFNELVKIMDCYDNNDQIVIPVFFKVDPSEVRKQSDTFGVALAQNEGDPNMQRWRAALRKAADLSGWDSRVTTPEATLVTRIVTDILGKLYHNPSSDFGELVGMGSHVNQIESILSRIHNKVRIIGLWGMGGIGKTTLAKTFFYHNFPRFEGHCILENIRERYEKGRLNELQEKLVTELLKDKNFNVGTLNIEIPFIRDVLRRKKVLIVLDDVNDCQHIEDLMGGRDSVGPGSIIIITSRDKQVLKNFVDDTYEVRGLDGNESVRLFSLHAFKEKHPRDDHEMRLSNKAINYAKGHPLTLKILGSHLFKRSKEEQENILKKLEKTPHKDVQKVLLISYNGLDYQEKNLFLNIACFFKGQRVIDVKCFHASGSYNNYSANIGVLIDKCLITLRYGDVWMHDLIQEMGWQIVREESIEEPGKRSRLCDHTDICHVLTKNTGTEAVKGMLFYSIPGQQLSISSVAFERMPNLEFLEIRDCSRFHKIRDCSSTLCFPHGLEYLSNKLRYMHWEKYPLTYMPSNFHPENLVSFIMRDSHVERLWNGRQNLVHLKLISLSFSKKLIEIPDLSLAKNLEALHLAGCVRLKNIQVRNISNLKTLNLMGCSLINKFPKVPSKIQHLYLDGTPIKKIPSTISNLKSLVTLSIAQRDRFYETDPRGYVDFFEGFGDIHPKELIDHPVEQFSSLKSLYLCGMHFQEIPFAIKQLINLDYLIVRNCKRLQSLPQLPMNVRFVDAENCISLETVTSPLFASVGKGEIGIRFVNCCKLDQDARNNIVANVERRLLHQRTTHPKHFWPKPHRPEAFGQIVPRACISFSGGDIPEWFDYKSWGSSLTAKLPPRWCNSDLFCLVFSVAVGFNEYIKYQKQLYYQRYYIKLNGGDELQSLFTECFSRLEDSPQPNHVILVYCPPLVNYWRKYEEESDNANEISIEFKSRFNENEKYFTIKKCGFHLLYTQDVEIRCCHSVVQPNSPCGDLIEFMDGVKESVKTKLSLKQDCVEDVEESTIEEDAKGNGGHNNDNSCNVGQPIEGWDPTRRRGNKMKWKLNTFKFAKFLRVQMKSTRKIWRKRNHCKFKVWDP